MKTATFVKQNWTRVFMLMLFFTLGIYSCQVNAQTPFKIKHIGMEGSFGVRSFLVTSNINQIKNMRASHDGGSLGVVLGNRKVKYKLTAGYYFSSGNTPQTQDLYELAQHMNYYPLISILPKSKIQLYITQGISLNKLKFYGNYLDDQPSRTLHEPHIGSLNQISLSGGLGLEYRVPSPCDIIHIFAEAQFGTPVQLNASNKAFSLTKLNQSTQFNIGVSFGRKR
jgi:hypothetical protein